ncbi:hypothetical protein C9374_004198 [Naegleria lovaniensis]|uniref:CUE domain-containing protein n=1 Tax=Naegleria lovaniensis TaxID=51637 RepID=A0AA88GSG6_NAELO|nr:uncharacterized protein C9374_004198 [Naegleria lovaniensis]KAG2383527.1 hypothetical protein C9374_004198 [Naegleria lovaniensis]
MSQPKITLQEAMSTLTSMFPSFDEGTIKSVLYQTNGHMERTIELLLGMVPEGGDEIPRGANTTTHQQQSSLANQQQQPSNNTSSSSSTIQHTLDDNFLRYSNLNVDMNSGSNTGNYYYDEQSDAPLYTEDEIYAYRLQKSLYEQGLSSVPPQMPGMDEPVLDPTPSRSQNPNIRRDVDSGFSSRGIGSNSSASSQTSFTFDQLSDFAKKKFADFKKRFTTNTANRNTNTQNPEQDKEEERMRTGLLGQHDDDDENDRL